MVLLQKYLSKLATRCIHVALLGCKGVGLVLRVQAGQGTGWSAQGQGGRGWYALGYSDKTEGRQNHKLRERATRHVEGKEAAIHRLIGRIHGQKIRVRWRRLGFRSREEDRSEERGGRGWQSRDRWRWEEQLFHWRKWAQLLSSNLWHHVFIRDRDCKINVAWVIDSWVC